MINFNKNITNEGNTKIRETIQFETMGAPVILWVRITTKEYLYIYYISFQCTLMPAFISIFFFIIQHY